MKVLQLIVIVLLSTGLCAQNSSFGVRVGIDRSGIRPYPVGNSSKLGVITGLTYQYKFNPKSSFNVDVLYVQKGVKGTIKLTDETAAVIIDGKVKLNMNYISIPLRYGVSIGERNNFFARIGLVPSVPLSANFIIKTDDDSFDDKESFIDDIRPFEFGGIFEAGVFVQKSNKHSIYIIAGFNRGFTNIYAEDYEIHIPRHLMIDVSVGIQFFKSDK